MPSNPNTDTKQNITVATTTKAFITGVTTTPTATAKALTGVADTGVYLTTTAGQLAATSFMVVGSANSSNIISSDSASNIYAKVNDKISLVITDTAIRSATSLNGTVNLGTSTVKWNYVYANYFNGDGSALTSLDASNISSGTIGFARLPSIYWANIAVTDAASYSTTPEVAKVKINGNTAAAAASSKNVELVYDSTLEVLNFVFT